MFLQRLEIFGVTITDCVIQSWARSLGFSTGTQKNKPWVDYEPRSTYGRAVNNINFGSVTLYMATILMPPQKGTNMYDISIQGSRNLS